jgi:signal peptidase II
LISGRSALRAAVVAAVVVVADQATKALVRENVDLGSRDGVFPGVELVHVHNRTRRLVWLPTGLLLGGAAGNLIDRLDRGYVTDFIDLPAWPAFNLADMSITFGVLSLLYVLEGPPRHADD